MSPAALTKAVKELEIALGVSLVVRTARGVQHRVRSAVAGARAAIVAEMQRARDDIEQAQGA